MAREAFGPDDLNAWVDGRLDDARAREIEAWLEANPAEGERWRDYRVHREVLQAVYDPVLSEPVPTRLRPASIRAGRRRDWPAQAAAAVLLLAVGAAAGWLGHEALTPDSAVVASLARDAVVAHRVYIPEVRHPVEVAADQEAHLVTWLSKRIGQPVKAPQLAEAGFQLVGGRLLPSADGPAAQFMYQDASGGRLTLYVRLSGTRQDTAFRFMEEGGASAFYWTDAGLGYALIGNMSRERLWAVANAVYRQLTRL